MTKLDLRTDAEDISKEYNQYLDDYEGLSLKEMVLSLWGYRRIIAALTFSAGLLIVAIGTSLYLFQQRQDITRLSFRLDFEGIEDSRYPSGGKFSTSDFLSTPVVSRVYEANNLGRYLDIAKFRSSLAIFQTSDKIMLLEKEYAAKLDDRKLTVEQRSRLEAEFVEKKKSLMSPVFSLNLSGDGSVLSIPRGLRAKVMQDLLSAWAEYADRIKGANKYHIALVSRNILKKEELEREDYMVAIDMLRETVRRILADIEKLKEIPGSATFRLEKNGVSLLDLNYRMLDIEKFKLSPLMGLIRIGGITKDEELTKVYLGHRIFELGIKQDDSTSREKVQEAALNNYLQGAKTTIASADLGAAFQQGATTSSFAGNIPTMIPQLGETFLNSIIKMAQENLDAKFRQDLTQKIINEGLDKVGIASEIKYYQILLAGLTEHGKDSSGSGVAKVVGTKVIASVEEVYKAIMLSIDEMNQIYDGLSKANLNPSGILFTVLEPVVQFQDRSLSLKKTLIYMVLAWVLVEGFIFIGVLIANSFRRKEQ